MKNLGKIKLLSAREQVASILRRAIISGELKSEQELNLAEIASNLGVSSMPVREAFLLLETDGLIRLRPNKGAVIIGVTPKSIKDHYETRALLEGEMAARASRTGSNITAVKEAYRIAHEAVNNNQTDDYSEQNQGFHMAIWEAADNEKMKSILSNLWNGLSMGEKTTRDEYALKSLNEHYELLCAIENHQQEEARAKMSDHIMRSLDDMMSRYKK